MPEYSWNELAQAIAEGEAVLVIGTDAIPFYPAQGGGEAQFILHQKTIHL